MKTRRFQVRLTVKQPDESMAVLFKVILHSIGLALGAIGVEMTDSYIEEVIPKKQRRV